MVIDAPENLVAAIHGPSPAYKRAAIDAILARREETTPHLVRLLSDIARDPARFVAARRGDDFTALYTLVLLAHLRETRAHAPLLTIARLPVPLADAVLSGFVIEGLPALLVATCGGDLRGIRALLTDPAVPVFSRAHAGDALTLAVHLGYTSRDEALGLLASQLTREQAGADTVTPVSPWTCAMLQLGAIDYRDALRRAWDERLFDDFLFGSWSEIEQELTGDTDDNRERLARACETALPSDVHGWMDGWTCFAPPSLPAPRSFGGKLPRNGPCWCGSGRKYKGCHFASDQARR